MTTLPAIPQSKLLAEEPAVTVGAGGTLATLVVNAVISYGVPITLDLKLLIVFVIGAVAPLVVGFLTRKQVFSPATVATLKKGWDTVVDTARQTTPETPNTNPLPPTI